MELWDVEKRDIGREEGVSWALTPNRAKCSIMDARRQLMF